MAVGAKSTKEVPSAEELCRRMTRGWLLSYLDALDEMLVKRK